MNSDTSAEFWSAHYGLDAETHAKAVKTFRRWIENPFHPSLQFKLVNARRNVWSVRIPGGHRALCRRQGADVVWFWIGTHDEYLRLLD